MTGYSVIFFPGLNLIASLDIPQPLPCSDQCQSTYLSVDEVRRDAVRLFGVRCLSRRLYRIEGGAYLRVALRCSSLQPSLHLSVGKSLKAHWSLYVPHSGNYMYRTVVTVCTAQWSLYVPHSCHYMYRTVVTVCTAQCLLYVPYSGHYM